MMKIPKRMKAVVLEKPHTIKVEEVPVPQLALDELLLKVSYCGVCGSDVRYYRGENPWSSHTRGTGLENPPNIILGHEFSGKVVAVGSHSYDNLLGKEVVVLPYRVCGTCNDCRQGNHNLCQNMVHHGHGAGWGQRDFYPGGMAEYCPVWAEKCYEVPAALSLQEAALIDFVGVALHAVKGANFLPCRLVVVIGGGPVGSSIGQIVRAWGAQKVLIYDQSRFALKVCKDLGFDHLVFAGEQDFSKAVSKVSKGYGADFIFDTVCSKETQAMALGSLANKGTLVDLAISSTQVNIPLESLAGERQIRSSSNYLIPEFSTALDLVASSKIKLAPTITHRWRIEEAERVFKEHLEKEKYGIFKSVLHLG